jgi:hypothetical protein
MMTIVHRQLPSQVANILDVWDTLFHRWWVYHYLLGIAGLLSSIIVAAGYRLFSQQIISILSLLAAICMGLITFLMPSKRARAYVAAWRLLNDACNRYINDDTFTIKELLDAQKKGEDIISNSDPT